MSERRKCRRLRARIAHVHKQNSCSARDTVSDARHAHTETHTSSPTTSVHQLKSSLKTNSGAAAPDTVVIVVDVVLAAAVIVVVIVVDVAVVVDDADELIRCS